jgi:hypothetical protein
MEKAMENNEVEIGKACSRKKLPGKKRRCNGLLTVFGAQ